jgi:hypothetical protein
MPAVIVNLTSVPPAAPVPGLATGGTSAAGLTANTPGVPLDPSGVPTSSQPLPSSTPIVMSLPTAGDPLAIVGQYVVYQGQPYIYTAGISGGADYWKLDVTGSPSIRDVWANLSLYPAANYPLGTVFLATDRTVSYAVQQPGGVNTWIYYNGVYEDVIANVPSDLDQTSIGFIFRASDYFHSWQWNGTVWHLTTGGFPPGYIIQVLSPAYLPPGALWHALDGSTVPISQDNATLVNETLATVAGEYIAQ